MQQLGHPREEEASWEGTREQGNESDLKMSGCQGVSDSGFPQGCPAGGQHSEAGLHLGPAASQRDACLLC